MPATPKAAVLGRIIESSLAALTADPTLPLPVETTDADALLAQLHSSLAAGAGASAAAAGSSFHPVDAMLSSLDASSLRRLWSAGSADGQPEPPSTLPWVRLLAVKHADEGGRLEDALKHAQAAIEHTPTVVDVYVAKARVLKHAGSLGAAADELNRARMLDLADRHLNTKTVRSPLRCWLPSTVYIVKCNVCAGEVHAARRPLY